MLGSKAYALLPPTLFSPSPVLLFVTDVFSGLLLLPVTEPLASTVTFLPCHFEATDSFCCQY